MVPKFIEEEGKIIGPLTFKQFLYILGAVGICVPLWFLLPILLFLSLAIIILGGALFLVFWKIDNYSIPELAKNFFFFSLSSKIYLWKKKMMPPKIIKTKKPKKKEKEEPEKESPLKIGGKSQLKKLSSRLEIGE